MDTSTDTTPMQLWAGIECTVNRVGSRYFEQLRRSGHEHRISDLDLIAGLGVSAVRYPVLWERVSPEGAGYDWRWSDDRLQRLRELSIEPIVGLLHHGSGPPTTDLLDPAFPEKLANYARAVAERYPWATMYTPVNEPMTTARFSGLYGHWYPHCKDDASYLRALVQQCAGVVLAMREVRKVNPAAQLVQTEDLGKTYSTRPLAYQADFENARRWLGFDLLCGRVDAHHPLRRYLRNNGVQDHTLDWFVGNPCPPDVVGLNHYLSGMRFLDHRVERYPAHEVGGNGRHAYADVGAYNVRECEVDRPAALLRDAWQRYGLPLALTEVHNGCTREEQMRWLMQVWDGADEARAAGADVRAFTAWSVFGAFDWNKLVTCDANRYEPGVFDVRCNPPRPTALAGLLRDLGAGRRPAHPLLNQAGWWERDVRYWFEMDEADAS